MMHDLNGIYALIAQTFAILFGAWKTGASIQSRLDSIQTCLAELKVRMDGADKRTDVVNGRVDMLYLVLQAGDKLPVEKAAETQGTHE